MKIYLLDDPAKPGEYARFSHVGTWSDDPSCETCGQHRARLIEPLQIKWDEGTDRIGDFSWCGYTCVVLDSVRAFLEGGAFECEFGSVEVVRPTKKTRRPRVPFPYRGPNLSWLIPSPRLRLDEARSGVTVKSDCKACRQKRYTFKREGLVVGGGAWNGEKLFCFEQFEPSGAMFVTEAALSMFREAGFSNLCPRLAGFIEA